MPNQPFQSFNIAARWMNTDEIRMDARYYARNVVSSRMLLNNLKSQGIETCRLQDMSRDVFWPGRFKRKYVSEEDGRPFLLPSEVFRFVPEARKFIIDYPSNLDMKKGWILITRSGSVGRCMIATSILEDYVLSDDLIRIVGEGKGGLEYLFAYLKTWVGQAFLTKNRYGATVKHIEPHHVGGIPVPILPHIMEETNKKIGQAYRLLEVAQRSFLKARSLLYSELGLPELDEDKVKYFGKTDGRVVRCFRTDASRYDLRLDASYHTPLFRLVLDQLANVKSGRTRKLNELAHSFVPPRFKRLYVRDPKDGVPMLQGAHVPQIVAQDIKHVWKQMPNLNLYTVRKNWILVTCSGTIGMTGLVRDYWNGWAATNHMLRIVCDEQKIHPGYLTAFLLSDYGRVQFNRLAYGGVVDEIGEAGNQIHNILILKPHSEKVEQKIGNLVFKAFDKKDRAIGIEEEAIRMLEHRLEELQGGGVPLVRRETV